MTSCAHALPPTGLAAGVVYDENTPADIVVLQGDFLVALAQLEPSVSAEDLKKYDELRHFHNQPPPIPPP